MNPVATEHALRAASGIAWQRLGMLAAGGCGQLSADYFDLPRAIIAEYLRHLGRHAEAMEVDAVGCNEPAPVVVFGGLRDVMEESHG